MAINFKRLEEIASSLKENNQTGKSHHVTFIYQGNKLIRIGQNNYKKLHRRHKYGFYNATKKSNNNYVAGLHSEVDAIIRLGLNDCFDYTFVNIRLDNNGNPAISKPCPNCYKLLRNIGYKYLYYFDGNEYVKEKFN